MSVWSDHAARMREVMTMDGAVCSITLTPVQYCGCGSCTQSKVMANNLAEQIEDAKRVVAGWPIEVRRALGIPESRPRLIKDPTRPRNTADV